MEKGTESEALFRKFIANRCSPEEIEQVLNCLKTSEAAKTLFHRLISQELQKAAFSNHRIDTRITEEIRRKILERIDNRDIPKLVTEVPLAMVKRKSRSYWKLAAVFASLLLLAGAGYRLFIYKPWITRSTSFGEIATIVLPDSSTVILNGNSKIRYASGLGWNVREVWIEGEAFFSVRHTHDDRKFIVHSSEDVDVEVLGTEFNVYDRTDVTRIVLNSGKVKLSIRKDNEETSHVDMQPGELVELHENSEYEKRDVNPEYYSSWISGKIVLKSTSFREITVLLEETYGLSVDVPDTSLYSERFSGTVPSKNAETLLKALALSFDLDIKTSGNEVIFKTKSDK